MPETAARDSMLARIRDCVGPSTIAAAQAAYPSLPHAYSRTLGLAEAGKLDLLVDRLRDYDALVYRIAAADVPQTIASILHTLPVAPVLLPPGFPPALLPAAHTFVADADFAPHQLDVYTTVLTLSTLAIAQTGTVVLQNVPGQGRRAVSLVPDVHLCIVRAENVVETVPQAMDRLAATARLPTTLISGPSATADIEMTRIKGVHGPRFLHVLLVENNHSDDQALA